MAQLTQEYLESIGFKLHWGQDHNYKSTYSKWNSEVTRAIILVSRTNSLSRCQGELDEIFDIWFWGVDTSGRYAEVDSHMSISSIEELETLLGYFR